MPSSSEPDDPDGAVTGARIVRLPATPGPPPPLPRDLVRDELAIPPRPPLPRAGADAAEEPATDADAADEPAPVADESPADATAAEAPARGPATDEADHEEPVDDAPGAEESDLPAEVEDLADADPAGPVVAEDGPVEEVAAGDVLVAQAPAAEDPAAVVTSHELHVGELPEEFSPPVPDGAEAVLELRGVAKSFGNARAVEGIDLTVPAGTFYGLVGPNGAGKTTTLSMIAGLLRPDAGTIRVAGVDAGAHPRAAKRMIGVLPDRLRTFDRLTGRQLLYYSGVLRGLAPAVVESRTADLARAFDLTDSLGRVVSDYSAGMLKKVMLAGALIHAPRLLVLDEPFEAVDPVSSAVILDILSTYVAHGGTVILSSHGMELVERMCSRVAVIVAGQVLAEGSVDEVRGELTLEQRFIELAGGLSDVEGLEWLHTFSD